MKDNFAFDGRVAGIYNAQRAHPPEVSRAVGDAISSEAGVGARVLEIGVGTGRIALPVVGAGCRVVGIDLSPNMLSEVLGFPAGLSLAQADMHHMPFQSNGFDAVLAVHVLHLAKDLRGVLTEVTRILRPGGVFIQGDDWIDPHSVIGRLRDELRRRVAAAAPHLRPPAAGVSVPQMLGELGGGEAKKFTAAEWTVMISPAERLRAIEQRADAESWILTPDLFDDMLGQLREFAAETWGDLDKQQAVTRRFVITATRGDW